MCRRTSLGSVSLALIAALLCGAARAQCFETKLQEPGSNVEDRFGGQVLMHEDLLFVSESGSDDAGLVHVFSEQPLGWVQVTTFAPAASERGQHFGGTLAADGDVILAGARGVVSSPEAFVGGAWIFVRDRMGTPTPLDDQWIELQALRPTDPSPPAELGWSVALSGGTALVGAPGLFTAPGGAAYVFVRDDQGTPSLLDDRWSQQARLDPSPLTTGTRLGTSVALMDGGQLALASDPSDDAGAPGGVLQWTRDDNGTPDPLDDAWVPAVQIEAMAPDALRETFVVDGKRLFAQAAHETVGFEPSSRIDVFERSAGNWSLVQSIENPLPAWEPFGGYLAARGDWLVTGGLSWSLGPPFHGTYSIVYQRVGGMWTHVVTTLSPDESVRDGFGHSASIAGSRLFLGAPGGPYDDDWPAVEGAVYVVEPEETNGWTKLDPLTLDLKLAGWGCLDGTSSVTVRAYDTFFVSMPAFLVIGFSLLDAPLLGQQLVPNPDLIVPVLLGPNGDVALTADWPPGVPVGLSVWFQAWENLGFGGFWIASNGLQVTQPAP